MKNSNIQYDGFDPKWKVRANPSYPIIHKNVSGWEIIGEQVCNIAEEIFKLCGSENDYCIQDNSRFGTVVFGSVNRVIWRVSTGFRIDEGYCTPEFIEKFPEARKEMEEYY